MSDVLVTVRNKIDCINRMSGRAIAWTALALVLVQFLVVLLRYVFSIGFIWMQESVLYFHGLLFMIGAGYTLLHEGHVRVDILYGSLSPRKRAIIDLVGSLGFLLPLCIFTFILSWSYVLNAWRIFEGSPETGGIPLFFLFKTIVWVFATLLGLQAVSLAIKAWLQLSGHQTYDLADDGRQPEH